MGRRGPQPIPTAEKIRRGETRPSVLNLTEPIPRQRVPRMPVGLPPSARAVWTRVLREMPEGVIVAADTDLLVAYCEAVVRYRRASKAYGESVGILKGRDGGPVANPLHRIVRDWSAEVRVLARELGLSPAARAGLHVEGGDGVADGIEAQIGQSPRMRVVSGGRRGLDDE
jgi:P27 family predicted phage terminase small subunit